MSDTLRHAQALPDGSLIGRYTVRRLLGAGAFGITYEVEDANRGRFALKEFFPVGLAVRSASGGVEPVSPALAADIETQTAAFRREAEILRDLDHPNVISVLDVISANGTAAFVMPLQAGGTLAAFLRENGPLDGARARAIAGALCEGLEHLHVAGIIHRDIKPENILVDPEGGQPKLIDFGAAKAAAPGATQLNTRIGTDHYSAPEQLAGAGRVGPWSDLYALSATLYEAISGLVPTDGAARQNAVLNGGRDPLADLSARRDLVAMHGAGLTGAIMSGLALRSADRPQSVDAWREILDGRAVPHRPAAGAIPTPAPDPHGFAPYTPAPERAPWGRWLAGLVVLAAILAGGVWLALNASPPAPAEQDVAAPDAAGETAPQPVRSSDDEAWVRALEQDTLEGYRAYLEAFPNGRHADDAQAEIDRYDNAAWERAEQRGTIAGYEDYLEDWADGLHASKARERIDTMRAAADAAAADAAERARQEAADWQNAARIDTIASYTAYLDKHPTGANAGEARSRRDRLQAQAADRAAWDTAVSIDTADAYQQYLSSYPQGAFVMQAQTALDRLRPAPGRVIRDCSECPPMMVLPAGTASLGAPQGDSEAQPAEGPQRPVTFSQPFAISVTEVTFDQWRACVSAGACRAIASDNGWGRGNRPVINVSWDDAQAYAGWLSAETGLAYSLPSEAQWEYAARAGQGATYQGGSPAALCAFANGAGSESGLDWGNADCGDPAPDRTLPAGALSANAFGVKDMIGNVAEWTLDCNTLNLRDAPADGSADMRGSCGQRAVRGGSWFSGPSDLRFTARMMLRRGDSNDFTGIRVVRRIEP